MSVEIRNKYSTGDIVKGIITIALPIVVLMIPTTEVFTSQLRLFFAITLCAILCFAFENVNQTAVALLMPLAYIFFGVAPAGVVYGPWTQYMPWATLSGLIMAVVLESTGLLQRVAYFCILKTGARFNGILWGVAIAGLLLTMFVGSVIYPMAALTYGICLALNTGKSKASAAIMLTGAMSCLLPNMMKFTGPLLMIGIGEPVTGPLELLGFFESWFVNMPALIYLMVMVLVGCFFFKPDHPIEGKTYFQEKLQGMGKITKREWQAIFILVIYFIFIITDKYHPFPLTWGLAFVPLLLVVPGIGPGTNEDMRKVNWPFILFVTACMAIGSVGVSLGIGKIMVDIVMPLVAGKSYYVFFFIEWISLAGLNFVMTPLAMEAAFTVPFATIGQSLGLNPMAIYFFMMHGVDQIIMPYEYALYLFSFAFGLIHIKDFMKMMGIKMIVNFIICFALLLPWWKLIGFLFA